MDQTYNFREYARYTALSVVGMLALSCYILADTFFVSKSLGTEGLAALNIAIPVYNFIHGTGLMLGMGGATRFSICRSRGAHREADEMFTNTLYMAAGFSALFAALGLFFSGELAALLGADEEIFAMSRTYMQVLLLFSPAFILNDIFVCYVRNDGNPQLSMAATAGGSFSNIVLDYVFMFPLGMGIFGAVLATGLAPVIGIAIMSPHWLKASKGFHAVRTGLSAAHVRNNLALGFPSLLAQLSSGIVIIVFNAIILRLTGNTGVAAYGVVANLSLVIAAVYTGIAQGIQPLVSREYGKGNKKAQRSFLTWALYSMAVLSVLLYAGIFLEADPIARIFNSENDLRLQEIAVPGLKLYFTAILFMGYNVILSTYFTSVEKVIPAHVVSLLRGLLLIVPAAFVMAGLWGMTGVWLAFPVTEGITAVLGFRMDARRR